MVTIFGSSKSGTKLDKKMILMILLTTQCLTQTTSSVDRSPGIDSSEFKNGASQYSEIVAKKTSYREYAQTLVCSSNYYPNVNYLKSASALIFYFAILIYSIFLMIRFSKKINLFPVRERAPYVALVQGAFFILASLMLLITEVLVLFRVGWNLGDEEQQKGYNLTSPRSQLSRGDYGDLGDIVFSRKFIKATWFTMRILSYTLFVVRTGVVFRNWRAKASDNGLNVYKGVREMFRNEKECLLVSFNFIITEF